MVWKSWNAFNFKKDCQKNICFPRKILQVTTRNDATLPIATRRLCGSPRSAPSWCFPWEVALRQAEETGGSPAFGFCVAHNSGADGRSLPRMRRVRRLWVSRVGPHFSPGCRWRNVKYKQITSSIWKNLSYEAARSSDTNPIPRLPT